MKKNIFKKIWIVGSNKIKEFKQDLYYKKRAKETQALRRKRVSDLNRWKKPGELYSDWDERTQILAGFIKPGANIIEFGAGKMAIKKFLPSNCVYTASDIHKRADDVIICDLNNKISIDLTKYDTAVFSGVLEYVYDLESVFYQLADSIQNVVISYACSDISIANRLKKGWLSDYSKKDLETIFEKYQYEVIEYREWRNQSIYNLKKT